MQKDIHAVSVEPDPLATICWPLVPGTSERPFWTEEGFRIGSRIEPVLVNAVGAAGWNDDLAELVDFEVSNDRPIGMASRRYALSALATFGAMHPGRVIMDIGCANGYMLEAIRDASPDTAVIGCDYALPPLIKLAKRLPGVPLLQLDLAHADLPDSMCDGIVLLNVLEHIEDDEAALRQICRMLRPRGVVVIEVPAGPNLYDSFDQLVGHFRRYSMSELLRKMESAGFEILNRSHLGFFGYPAFWLLKRRNQRLVEGDEALARQTVVRTIRKGRSSLLQRAIFTIENALRPFVPMPFGIRCLITARRG